MTPDDSSSRRVGITHFAGRAGDHNDRAMAASPRLSAALAARFRTQAETIGVPQPALSAGWKEELDLARGELRLMQERYRSLLSSGQAPVTALSRCAVALSTLPAVAEARPDAVVVWFDAHADINGPENTTTGYLGGLALAGPLGLWDSGLGAGLSLSQTALAGARDIDPPESALIDASDLSLVGPGPRLAERLGEAVGDRPVYVHIDCDVLSPGIVPTDYHVPGGLSLDELQAAASVLSRREVVGLEIGELETETGEEDLQPLMTALEPLFQAVEAAAVQ